MSPNRTIQRFFAIIAVIGFFLTAHILPAWAQEPVQDAVTAPVPAEISDNEQAGTGSVPAEISENAQSGGEKDDFYRWSLTLGVGSSLLSDSTDSSYFAETLGVSLVLGYRISRRFTVHLHIEQNTWRSQDNNEQWNSGVFNIGAGVDYELISPHVHANATLGASILTFDTTFDKAGTTGLFFEFAPIDLRWVFINRVFISFYPLSFHIEAPSLNKPGIRYTQYRTVLRVGGLF